MRNLVLALLLIIVVVVPVNADDTQEGITSDELVPQERELLAHVEDVVGVRPQVIVGGDLGQFAGNPVRGRYHVGEDVIKLSVERDSLVLAHEIVHWADHHMAQSTEWERGVRAVLDTHSGWSMSPAVSYHHRPEEKRAFGLEKAMLSLAENAVEADRQRVELARHLLTNTEPPMDVDMFDFLAVVLGMFVALLGLAWLVGQEA